MNTTVIIVTLNRPELVRRCLNCLEEQTRRAEQIIVVDASPDDRTQKVVRQFPQVTYLRNENGWGRMTASRNIGLKEATGDVIAFIDDDAFAHPNWLENLVATYSEPTIGAVGGRTLSGLLPQENAPADQIGRIRHNGALTGNFDANPGRIIEVDHVMGCNMSFRRELLRRLGGFREDCRGISGVREDSDMCLRVKRLGYRILFNPSATVDHIGAPQAKGKRFDATYVYYNHRNHLILLIRNLGPGTGIIYRNLCHTTGYALTEFARRIGGAIARLTAAGCGTAAGISLGIVYRIKTGADPVRHDAEGEAIRKALTEKEIREEVGV